MRASETSKEGKEKVQAVISCRGCWEHRSQLLLGPLDEEPALGAPGPVPSLRSLARFPLPVLAPEFPCWAFGLPLGGWPWLWTQRVWIQVPALPPAKGVFLDGSPGFLRLLLPHL